MLEACHSRNVTAFKEASHDLKAAGCDGTYAEAIVITRAEPFVLYWSLFMPLERKLAL